ncbi:MAG: hypothetical protein KA137_06495 [Halioglobus sp.]|nr:hypothetical protein [Halioglobus sp.]
MKKYFSCRLYTAVVEITPGVLVLAAQESATETAGESVVKERIVQRNPGLARNGHP